MKASASGSSQTSGSPKHPRRSPTFIDLGEIGFELAIDKKTARRRLKEAGVKAFLLAGGRSGSVRYRRDEYEHWLASCREN